jgi:hypothetical protein
VGRRAGGLTRAIEPGDGVELLVEVVNHRAVGIRLEAVENDTLRAEHEVDTGGEGASELREREQAAM